MFPIFSHADRMLVGEWYHEVKTDRMSDITTCAVKTTSNIMPSPIIIFDPSGIYIAVIEELYPGKNVTVRIDKNTAISGKKWIKGNDALTVINEIRNGGEIMLIESYKWPSKAPYYLTVKLEGVFEHLDACEKVMGVNK
jgi:hypothetical protein